MANELLTIDQITYKGLSILKNSLVMGNLVNRQFDASFGVAGAKIGDTLRIRKPPRYVGREGAALAPEATVETKVNLTLDYLFGVDLSFSSVERTLSLDDYGDRVLKPAIATVANKIDNRLFQVAYPQVYNAVGTPGTVPSTIDTYLSAGVKLDNEAAPMDEQRYMVTNSQMQATLMPTTAVYFNPNGVISEQYRKGRFGKQVLGFDWYMSQNAPTHTFGTFTASGLIDGAGQVGTSLVTKTWTGSATSLNYGDVFTIANVYAVNPQSRQSTGQLRQFTVMNQPVASSGAGTALTLTISPGIYPTGQGQTVDSSPADSAQITIATTTGKVTPIALAFHKDAITLATADLELPKGVHEAARATDPDSGLSLRIVTAYNINDNNMYTRIEVLAGIAVLRPELACRVWS
jgi:hypothetical protein